MANRYYNPVNFALEQNVVTLSARVVFSTVGSQSGVPTLDTQNSKGICALNLQSVGFTGGTTNSSTTLGSISSFNSLYTGMTLFGPAGALQGATTIGSLSAGGSSLTMSKQAITTAEGSFTATGGRYLVQFGTQAGVRMDSYYKLLGVTASWDVSGSASGYAGSLALAPAAPQVFIVNNNTRQKTIPASSTSASTDCSLTLQLGMGQGTSFVAYNPQDKEAVRLTFVFANSSGQ